MNSTTKNIVISAMFASLCCIATMIIKIPSPLKGYINFGDCIVIITGFMLSPLYGFLASGIGSALADVFSGFITYAPVTFIIKGFMALIAGYVFHMTRKKTGFMPATILSGALAELVMIIGYYIFEGFMYGFIPAVVNLPASFLQGIAGLTLGILLAQILKKHQIMQ